MRTAFLLPCRTGIFQNKILLLMNWPSCSFTRLFMKGVSISWNYFVARIIQTIHHLLDFRLGLTWLVSTKKLER